MRPKEHIVMSDCVEQGIRYGLTRAFKHTTDPTEETIIAEIQQAVLDKIDEYWSYDDECT